MRGCDLSGEGRTPHPRIESGAGSCRLSSLRSPRRQALSLWERWRLFRHTSRWGSQLFPRGRERLFGVGAFDLGQRLAVFDRHDLAELRQVLLPAVEDLAGPARAGVVDVALDELSGTGATAPGLPRTTADEWERIALDEKKTPDDIVAALVKSWGRRGQG